MEDVMDDTEDLVDDALDRTKDVERDTPKAARTAVDTNESAPADELTDLKNAIDELTAKVERLVSLQAQSRKTSS